MVIFENIRLKKPNHNLSFKRRHGLGQNLTSNEQVKLLQSKKFLVASLIMSKRKPGNTKLYRIRKACILKYISLCFVEDIPLEPTVNRRRDIDSFGQGIKKDFRFEAIDLRFLIRELGFSNPVIFDNKINMPGEEVFLRGFIQCFF